jgi:hypothetical protein
MKNIPAVGMKVNAHSAHICENKHEWVSNSSEAVCHEIAYFRFFSRQDCKFPGNAMWSCYLSADFFESSEGGLHKGKNLLVPSTRFLDKRDNLFGNDL